MTPSRQQGVRSEATEEHTEISGPPGAWDPSSRSAYLEPGTQLGEYRIDAPIGEGGMGVVYAAIHPLIGKRAAVKVLKAELCRSEFNVERFIDEARIVNQIGHPNIVDVFAFGQTADGRSYMVMEWLKGESLRARCARAELDLEEIYDIVRPLARALEAAHEHGVIHRDLKPDNVFLVEVRGEAPLVKLLDFGIAKLARRAHDLERTETGEMVGTPQYIAPEQAKGHAIDHRADIYALGGILFELLTGHPPYISDNAMEMIAKHLMEPVPRPSSIAYVPPDLDDLVVRMLSKVPEERPSLGEVATIIEVERARMLERTEVKHPAAPARPAARPGPPSEVIEPPAPTLDALPARSESATRPYAPPTRPTVKAHRAPSPVVLANPALLEAPPIAMANRGRAPSHGEITEYVRAPSPQSTRQRKVVLAPIVFLFGLVAMFFAVRAFNADDDRAATEPQAAAATHTDGAPAREPPALEPPAPTPAPTPAPPKPQQIELPSDPPRPAAAPVDPPPPPSIRVPPRPPPPAKPKLGRLELSISGGKGAPGISIDGKPSGTVAELERGEHTVEVTSEGAKKARFTVTITEDRTTTRAVKLEPIAPMIDPTKPDDLLPPGSIVPKRSP